MSRTVSAGRDGGGPHPASPLKRYFSRKHSSVIRTNDLPLERCARGIYTPAGIFFACIKLTVPLAYVYILLILLRELCTSFPETVYLPVEKYLPAVASVVSQMKKSSLIVEVWAVIEAIFYICLVLHLQWLNYLDPLEMCLNAAPMLELHERQQMWERIMESESDDPVSFITGWFFDAELESISKYDILDFGAWSMFEGRNQEHLSQDELRQLHGFVAELEYRVSIHLYGSEPNDHKADDSKGILSREGVTEKKMDSSLSLTSFGSTSDVSEEKKWSPDEKLKGARPRKLFHFQECAHDASPTFFTNLYENYKQRYEQHRERLGNRYEQLSEKLDFHPMQDFRNFVAEKRQRIHEAEENAMATASHMYENAYFSLVDKGSNFDKQLTALSQATQSQLTQAWNSMWKVKERLETAELLSARRKKLRQQLKSYRLLLDRMRSMSIAVPPKQMADLMRKISQCNEALELVEGSARDAFVKATGYARKNLLPRKEPQRYAKYSSDPLLGVSSYPLMFHFLLLGITDGGLRILMQKRGFERRTVGPISYYYHPGRSGMDLSEEGDDDEEDVPLVFCHGIGIGLIIYLPLIDSLLKLGKPMFLPEIPYVSGFRPWQSPTSVLNPACVSSTLMAMMACHGYDRGAFLGHSYGTSWLSYMCKYSPSAVAAVLFLDPICFCLHFPVLTKQFVYHRSDPGSTAYMIRTDVIINWTIQRCFPWTRISLFTEQIPNVPCAIFLSELDALVPSEKAEKYLRSKGAHVEDFSSANHEHFSRGPINVTMFRGLGHGDWIEQPSAHPKIAGAMDALLAKLNSSEERGRGR